MDRLFRVSSLTSSIRSIPANQKNWTGVYTTAWWTTHIIHTLLHASINSLHARTADYKNQKWFHLRTLQSVRSRGPAHNTWILATKCYVKLCMTNGSHYEMSLNMSGEWISHTELRRRGIRIHSVCVEASEIVNTYPSLSILVPLIRIGRLSDYFLHMLYSSIIYTIPLCI